MSMNVMSNDITVNFNTIDFSSLHCLLLGVVVVVVVVGFFFFFFFFFFKNKERGLKKNKFI
jgi:flagellar basal body-associated protein FliL